MVAIAAVTCSFPSLDDLTVTFTNLTLDRATGKFGADSVDVSSAGFVQTIGLGGVLPFDVTDITVTFPDHTDLDRFAVAVEGRFDFTPFQGLPFTPEIGLGGVAVTPTSPPDQNHFSFSVSIDNGVVRPLDVSDITLGFSDLHLGGFTLAADLHLGGFVDGVLQNTVGGSISVAGGIDVVSGSLAATVDGSITPTADGAVVDASGDVTVTATIGSSPSIELDGLQLHYRLGIMRRFDDQHRPARERAQLRPPVGADR